jgi:hypothetical protein
VRVGRDVFTATSAILLPMGMVWASGCGVGQCQRWLEASGQPLGSSARPTGSPGLVRLGFRLFSCGFAWIRGWCHPEGFMGGSRPWGSVRPLEGMGPLAG